MKIKVLSRNIINKIAAGEVIDRPASVIKELVENSLDAGSSKIDIVLECAGKNLIIVQDNGNGISKQELAVSVQRHTTSKLDENDLFNISSFGFRGEALPSIGVVSKFRIESQTHTSRTGYGLSIINGVIKPTRVINSTVGTLVEVRDLFFATPTRLKFLRTNKTELSSIISYIKKVSLSQHKVSFTLVHNNKELLKIKKTLGPNSIKDRITAIMGEQFIQNAKNIFLQKNNATVYGYISLKLYKRPTTIKQYIFVNNRPVRDRIINSAIKDICYSYVKRNIYPIYVLFLTLDPKQVDINVHPSKNEVRFHNPSAVQDMITYSIQNIINSSNNMEYCTKFINYSNIFVAPTKKRKIISDYTILNYTLIKTHRTYYASSLNHIKPDIQLKFNCNRFIKKERGSLTLGLAKMQYDEKYIISESNSGIIITNQNRAHKHMSFKQIQEEIKMNTLTKSRLISPEIIDLLYESRAATLIANRKTLLILGITIQKFNKTSVIISEIPSLVENIDISSLIFNLSNYYISSSTNIKSSALANYITDIYSSHYAITATKKLNITEMNRFLRKVESTDLVNQNNTQKKVFITLNTKNIEELFN